MGIDKLDVAALLRFHEMAITLAHAVASVPVGQQVHGDLEHEGVGVVDAGIVPQHPLENLLREVLGFRAIPDTARKERHQDTPPAPVEFSDVIACLHPHGGLLTSAPPYRRQVVSTG